MSDMQKRLRETIRKSPHADKLFTELYETRYGDQGPSISTSCSGMERPWWKCGCWVCQLIGLIQEAMPEVPSGPTSIAPSSISASPRYFEKE